MPYDILQLNDMLVPELVDVAENLKINNPRSLDKQTLIYRILDHQAVDNNGGHASNGADDEPKKRRGRKPKGESNGELIGAEQSKHRAANNNNANHDAVNA